MIHKALGEMSLFKLPEIISKEICNYGLSNTLLRSNNLVFDPRTLRLEVTVKESDSGTRVPMSVILPVLSIYLFTNREMHNGPFTLLHIALLWLLYVAGNNRTYFMFSCKVPDFLALLYANFDLLVRF